MENSSLLLLFAVEMPTGSNKVHNFVLDNAVGYSPYSEDLPKIDTLYVNPDCLEELSEMNLNIMHLNICGILNKQDSLSRLLVTLGGRNKANVVSLNKTWLHRKTE